MKKTDTQQYSRAALLKHLWLDQSHQPQHNSTWINPIRDSSCNAPFVCHQAASDVRSESLPATNKSFTANHIEPTGDSHTGRQNYMER